MPNRAEGDGELGSSFLEGFFLVFLSCGLKRDLDLGLLTILPLRVDLEIYPLNFHYLQ